MSIYDEYPELQSFNKEDESLYDAWLEFQSKHSGWEEDDAISFLQKEPRICSWQDVSEYCDQYTLK